MSGQFHVGVVVIGRNEGDRLKRCLRSLKNDCPVVIYVDSGSTDGSIEFARSLGVDVVDLDLSLPFTMARGRNAGFHRLCSVYPAIQFVQFVDGDCEVADGWISAAVAALESKPDVVAVCGRRREQSPQASMFNLMCDLEWDKPPGITQACGGDAMYRVAPLKDVCAFNETMIAGEEGELCFRLRGRGWKILRLPQEMTRHDAAITTWSQWGRRVFRGGHAFAEGAFLHGTSAERYNIRQTRSAVLWGIAMPTVALLITLLAILVDARLFILLSIPVLGWLILAYRIYRHGRRRGRQPRLCLMETLFCLLAKIPEGFGVVRFWTNRLAGKRSQLIEYK